MNDGIMYTFDVVSSDGGTVMFRCVRKETAEYLRDWCEAKDYNDSRNRWMLGRETEPVTDYWEKRITRSLCKYSICESEVIL